MERDAERLSAGGVTSPILSNIYLDRLDTFVEQFSYRSTPWA